MSHHFIYSSDQRYKDQPTLNKNPSKFIPAKKKAYQFKSVNLQNKKIDDAIDDLQFEKCRLSLKHTSINHETVKQVDTTNYKSDEIVDAIQNENIKNKENKISNNNEKDSKLNNNVENNTNEEHDNTSTEVHNVNVTPDIVRGMDYDEDDLASHRAKLEELQLKQKIMEEQNKKRKEMLSKALADR